MPNDISSIQNQIQNATMIHPGGHGHNKNINKMQFAMIENEKEIGMKPKTLFKSKMATEININPDADSEQKKQQKEKSSKGQTKDGESKKKPFGLDTLEIVGQMNMAAMYTLAAIKKPDQI
jgi:hypothetical protein